VAGGVLVQAGEGAELGGPGCEGAGGGAGDCGDLAGGDADDGFVDLEECGDRAAGHAEAVAADGGQEAGLGGEPGAGAVVARAAGAAAADVEALLAGGGQGDFQAGSENGEVLAGQAGDRGVCQGVQVRAGRGGRFRVWLRVRGGAGDGEQGVVLLAVELMPC